MTAPRPTRRQRAKADAPDPIHVSALVTAYLDRYQSRRRRRYRSGQWEWYTEYYLDPAVSDDADTGSQPKP